MDGVKIKKTTKNIILIALMLLFIFYLGFKNSVFLTIGLLAINVILFVHELGHFLTAKALKIPVYEFSVGIGPSIYSKEINEVKYCIRCVPLGGYVVLDPSNENEDSVENKVDSYKKINPFRRMLVILAGPVFNFLLAFVVITGVSIHRGFATTAIGNLIDNSAAQEYGLQAGDLILSINGIDIKKWEDITHITSQNEELTFKVNRNGKIQTIKVRANLDKDTNTYKVGINPEYKKDIFKSISAGINTTIYNIKTTTIGYVDIFKGIFVKNNNTDVELVGPVGTIRTISKSASYGTSYLLLMVFSMSISVGIFNLIPFIPNLDGGRLLFIFIEIIRGGKQLSQKIEENILFTGAFAILGLFLFTTIKDLTNLF